MPMVRFNPVSPYSNAITGVTTNITTEQLNMRRKAEILKYSSNRMPNQTNNLTKKQQWSRLVTQPNRGIPQTDNFNPDNCPTTIPVSSTASGIPGPPIMLYEDPNVPLYNYIVTRSYAYNVPNENAYWETTVNRNVGLYSGGIDSVFSLNILPEINRPQYRYGIVVPVGLHAEGINTASLPYWRTYMPNILDINIQTVSLTVYCNGTDITPKLLGYSTLTKNIPKTIDSHLIVSIPYVESQSFNVTQAIDHVFFTGINLFTSPVYTFDFKVQIDLEIYINGTMVPNPQSFVKGNLITYAYANMTDAIPVVSENCSVITPNPAIVLNAPILYA
jgi:hypothetical protein